IRIRVRRMRILSSFTDRARKLARYIEQPHLWRLRQRKVSLEMYLQLNQPWLQSLGIATILDIGANEGQFSLVASALWPQARLYAFEPLPEAFQQLTARLAGVENLTAFNFGLGQHQGEMPFERNTFSASSSFLPMAELHKVNYPHTQE